MEYKELMPGELLKQHVKCYYIFRSETGFLDTAFATGCMEVMFNVGSGRWLVQQNGNYVAGHSVELWGQIIQPMSFQAIGKSDILGIRFHPQGASVFLNEDVSEHNNRITDFSTAGGNSVRRLHQQLVEADTLTDQIALIEKHLLKRLDRFGKRTSQLTLVDSILNEIRKEDFFDNINNVAFRHGISSRYLQKLFLRHTGIAPKLYQKMHRFQKSLVMLGKPRNTSLSSIAYDCGYFDQAHFIKEFKFFTGMTPSAYHPESSTAILASPNK
jgi:AraC-like DNA-binding protein